MPMRIDQTSVALLFRNDFASRPRTAAGAPDLAAIASGQSLASGRATAPKAPGNLFAVGATDVAKMKIDLYERVGKAFGLDMHAYDSLTDYGKAVKEAIAEVKRTQGAGALVAIGDELGLDKLGVSFDTVIGAMLHAGGDEDKELTEALKAQSGDLPADNSKPADAANDNDDPGLYAP